MVSFDLVELGQGVFALTAIERGFGHSNLGLVIDTDGLTVIDTGPTPSLGQAAQREIQQLTKELGLPIKRVVLTSSRVAFTGGSAPFWKAAFYGSEPTSDQLDQPLNPEILGRLLPQFAGQYGSDFATRPVTHTVSESVWMTPAIQLVPAPGEGPMNLVAVLPAANVVFAGALGSFGTTPLAFDGDPELWADSLDQVAQFGATVIPGHGLPGGTADAALQADYLRACVGAARAGQPFIPGGPWDAWTDRHFDAINIERAQLLASGDRRPPDAMLQLLGLGEGPNGPR